MILILGLDAYHADSAAWLRIVTAASSEAAAKAGRQRERAAA